MLKQLEGLFAELSATLYGLPLVLWRVARSPVRGTLRLYFLHSHKHEAHIGPHSAVLLTAFLLSIWSGQRPVREMVRRVAGSLLTDGSGLTEPIVTSIILAAVIDGGCRLYGRIRYPSDVRRRSRAIAMLLYAAAFGILSIGPLFWLALMAMAAFDRLGLPHGTAALVILFSLWYGAAFAASWPLIAVYNAQRPAAARRSELVRDLQGLFPLVFLFGFAVASTLGGGLVRWIQTPQVRLSALYTTCTLDSAAVGIVTVLQNHTRDVMIVDSRNLGVRLTARQPERLVQIPLEVTRSSVAVAGGLITIPANGVGLVEATADPRHSRRSSDLEAQTRLDRCELVRMDSNRPMWLGERRSGSSILFPAFQWGPFTPWPDPSQETFDGTGTVIDRRDNASRPPDLRQP